jgi:hypothetical protein
MRAGSPFSEARNAQEAHVDLALESFRASLAARIAQIQANIVSAGKTARVGYE